MIFHRYSFYLKLRINQAKHSGPLIFGLTREDCRSTKSLRMASNNTSSRPSLKGKVAIVTGGCKGIGRGCVDVFVEDGGKVVVFDIEATVLRFGLPVLQMKKTRILAYKKHEIGAQIDSSQTPKKDGGEISYVHCDLREEENIKAGILSTIDKYGRIDCLVNNVGWNPPSKTIDDITAEDFKQLFDLNLMAGFLCCKYALPYLRKTKGSIVNISSLAGSCGADKSVTYCATKGGVNGMTKALALDEGKHGVRVNSVSPGQILTPLFKSWAQSQQTPENPDIDVIAEVGAYNILNRIGESREVGEACLFLATGATYVTGMDLPVSGGMEVGFGRRT